MKMIDHNHFICHLILGTFTEYPSIRTMLIIIYNVYLTLKQNFYYRHSTLRDRLIISNKTKK